jgi:hypothetical protein
MLTEFDATPPKPDHYTASISLMQCKRLFPSLNQWGASATITQFLEDYATCVNLAYAEMMRASGLTPVLNRIGNVKRVRFSHWVAYFDATVQSLGLQSPGTGHGPRASMETNGKIPPRPLPQCNVNAEY